jgi:predicted O-methyltransferase YrrM
MFHYTAVIPYTNRLDLLERAVAGIERWWNRTFIIDNSFGRDLDRHPLRNKVKGIITPLARLTCSQSFNTAQEIARANNSDVLFMLHGDADPRTGACERLEKYVQKLFAEKRQWGGVFTHYDVLAAFSIDAVDVIGEWDTAIEQYPVDFDYYHRLRTGGYPLLEAGGDDVGHYLSSTLKRDVFYEWRNKFVVPMNHDYNEQKWAGKAAFPFNGQPWDTFYQRVQSDNVFSDLMNVFQSNEGSFLYNTDRNGMLAQFSLLYNVLKAVKPKSILETGAHKCFFPYFVAQFLESFAIETCDLNPRSSKAISCFSAAYPNVHVNFHCGDSRDILSQIPPDSQFDLAWIDGGNTYEVVLSDLTAAIRLNIPNILVDDTAMASVKAAIETALADSTNFYIVQNPFKAIDVDRGITLIRKRRPAFLEN